MPKGRAIDALRFLAWLASRFAGAIAPPLCFWLVIIHHKCLSVNCQSWRLQLIDRVYLHKQITRQSN
jgi:hypothetical protein